MIDKETLRQKGLNDSQGFGTKQRFGLFSHPISTAIGDDGPYKTKLHPRNQQGKPLTQQRKFQTSPTRSGQLKSSYLGPLNSLATGQIHDVYIDEARRLQIEQNQRYNKGKKPDSTFIPASGSKTLNYSSYTYKEENPLPLQPKRNRQQDGRVKTKPRNFYTNPGSKVIHQFFKPHQHMIDPYERAKKIQIETQKRNKSLEGEAAFKPNCFTAKVLNKQKQVYGEDVQLKPKNPKSSKFNIYNHENPWKSSNPNKKGLYGYFQPFPKYKENPPKEIMRKNSQSQQKQIFKSMISSLTAPSPSITQHPTNIRKIFNNSFSHRF